MKKTRSHREARSQDGPKTQAQRAATCFLDGFSCSQAVLSTFAEDLGLARETALRISQPFGGGMAHRGETCGAVTGAFMVIGLKFGRVRVEDEEAKTKTYSRVSDFVQRFSHKHGSIVCRELIGHDLSKPQGYQEANEAMIFETLCPNFVRTAAEILEEILA